MQYMKLTEKEKARHPSIHYTGSVRGMKKLGFWKKGDRCVRCGQYIYNLSQTIGTYRPVYARGGVLIADDSETGRHLLCRRRRSNGQRAAGEPPGGGRQQ